MPAYRVITVSATALLALGLTACGTSHTPAAHAHSAPSAGVNGYQPATASAAPVAAATPAQPSAADVLAAWYASGGKATLATVNGDLGQISTDAQAENVAAVEADGAQLAADADAAGADGPGPQTAAGADWTEAMSDYSTSGQFAMSGDFTDATAQMQAGTTEIEAITALIGG